MSSFFVGAQTLVSLLQTTQIKQGGSFIAANKVYTSTNETQSVESRRDSYLFFFLPGVGASHVYVRALALGCFYSHIIISAGTFRRNYFWQSLEEGAGKQCSECEANTSNSNTVVFL